jgi:alpha-ketoglutarate-dependent taurine dioxygenase
MLKQYSFNSKEQAKTAFQSLISDWQQDASAKVFVVKSSLLIGDVQSYYESLFPWIGTPAALAEDAQMTEDRSHQRTGDIWMEVRYDPRFPDAYRHSPNAQPLHTDGSYIPTFPNATLLCCVSNAEDGGETIFLDTPDLVKALQVERPDLFEKLVNVSVLHERSGDAKDSPILYQKESRWWVNYNYHCVSDKVSEDVRLMIEDFHQFLQTSSMVQKAIQPVKLQPGDAVTWKDNEVLHGRFAFAPKMVSERFIWKCAIDIGEFAA